MKLSIFFVFGIILFWGLWGFFSKLAVQRIALQASFWNTIALSLIITIFLILTNQLTPLKINGSGIFFAVLAGICSGLASILFYTLLKGRPVGLLVAITALYPLVTIVLSLIFLKEPLTFLRLIGLVLALIALVFLNL